MKEKEILIDNEKTKEDKIKKEKGIEEKETKKQNKKTEQKETDKNEENKKEFKVVKNKNKEKEYKDIEKIKAKNKNRKIKLIILGIVIVLLLILSTIFAFININNNKILEGVSIKGIDVSGLSKEEAKEKIEKIYDEKKAKEIEFKYEEYETTINPTILETNYDIEAAVDEAIKIGKNDNIFINNFEIIKTYIMKKDIDVQMTINEEIAKQSVEDIGTKLPGIVVESSYYQEDSNLIIGKGSEGVKIDTDKMLEIVKSELNQIEINQDYLEIPVYIKTPDKIDLNKIHDEIYTEVQDAFYTKNPFEIHPEVEGVDFNVEEAQKILDGEDKEEYIIPLKITKPKVTIDQIGTEAFPDQLATFTTKYDASNSDRTTNLKIACQKLNGKVILAGETFSYNKTLGERTVAAGYRNGKIYENGEVVDGIGGGICQISSTLYNAVLMSNLEIVERRNHQFVTSYLPAGRDATVSYGTTDFRFKNTRKYPVRLVASISNGIATVSVYGIKESEEYTVSFNTKTISTIPQETQYIEDSSLSAGEEKVKQKGANGLVCETYITKSLNGKIVSQKLLSRDTYSAMPRIVLTGTGAAKQAPTTEEKQTTEETESKPPKQEETQNTTPVENTTQNQTTSE